MFVAEFPSNFDGCDTRPKVITLSQRPGGLEVQLRSEAMVDLHPAQREGGLVRVRFGEAALSPLWKVEACGGGQIELTRARWQAGTKRCRAVAHPTRLACARGRDVPGIPSCRQHVVAANQNTANRVIRPTNLIVKGGRTTVHIQVVIDRIDPAVAIVMEVRINAANVDI